MGTVTKTIGTSSRDYSTLQAWEDALPANLVTDGNAQVGECYNDSEFTARVSISGQTTDATNNITLRCASGQSFSDNTNKLTNRLAYNASNGVAVRTTTGYASAVIVVTTNNVLIEGLQVKATGTQTPAINASGTANVVRKCILSAVSRNNANDFVARVAGTGNLITNSLVIADASNGCTGVSVTTGGSAVNCTVVRPSNRTAGGKAFHAAYSTSTVKNCAIFGFSVSSTGTYASDGHNVTDHTSAPGSTSNITSATYANQFVQSSTGSSVEDFRIVGTGSDLDDAGTTDTTNIPAGDDIVGQTRSTWDVGCWEYVAAGGTDYPVTRAESADASDTASLTIIYAATATEIAEATSAHAAAMAAAASIAETGAATDTSSTAGLYGVTVAEASDAADVASAIRALFGTTSETGAATDTSNASLPGLYSVTVVEAANAEDEAAQAMSALVVIAEALAAADVANWVGAVIYTRAPRGGGYPATVQTTERYGTTNTKRPAMTNTRR